jgi:hypothetical protein
MAEAADDLSTPLGQATERRKRRFRLPFTATQALAVLLGLFLVTFVGVALFNDNPLGGEPVSRIAIRQPMQASEKSAATPLDAPATDTKSEPKQAMPGEQKTITIIDGSSGARHDVAIGSDSADKTEPEAAPMSMAGIDQRLLEKSRYGMIPLIADGLKPFTVYAAEADRAKAAKMPVVSIVVGGLGVGAAKTTDAIMKLPPAVTLAFTPYGSDPTKLTERARAQRHEILLQIPMEPFDYPDNDPGPQTLLTTLAPEQNLDRLYWHLSRFQGYAARARLSRRRLSAAQRRPFPGGSPDDALRQGRSHHRRGADGAGNRPGIGKTRKPGQRARNRGRDRLGAAGFDRADRGLDQGARGPRYHACAIDNRNAEIKIQLTLTRLGRRRTRRVSPDSVV